MTTSLAEQRRALQVRLDRATDRLAALRASDVPEPHRSQIAAETEQRIADTTDALARIDAAIDEARRKLAELEAAL